MVSPWSPSGPRWVCQRHGGHLTRGHLLGLPHSPSGPGAGGHIPTFVSLVMGMCPKRLPSDDAGCVPCIIPLITVDVSPSLFPG